VAAALAAEGWSLARLARRHGGRAQGRRRALPLLWEFGIPAAVAVVPTAVFKVNWKGLFLYGPGHELRAGRDRRPLRPHRANPGHQGGQSETSGTQPDASPPDARNGPAQVTTGRQRGARPPAAASKSPVMHDHGG
jgi:hypothetical protein